MRRSLTLSLILALALATPAALVGCSQAPSANAALAAANEQLKKYAQLDADMATQLTEAGSVQATPEGVAAGLATLDKVDQGLVQRKAAVIAATEQFKKIQAMDVKAPVKGYAKVSLELTTSLTALDVGIGLLAKDMRDLYTLVAKRSTETKKIQQLADSVDAAKAKVDRLRKRVREQSNAADAFYQKNLAPKPQ
jgi:cell division protein FtsB